MIKLVSVGSSGTGVEELCKKLAADGISFSYTYYEDPDITSQFVETIEIGVADAPNKPHDLRSN